MSIQSFIQAAQLLYQNNYFDEGLCLVHPQIILNYQLAIDINNLFHNIFVQ